MIDVIYNEIKEIRDMLQQYNAGKLDKNQVQSKIAMYSQTEKREKLIIQSIGILAKYGEKKHIKKFLDKSILIQAHSVDDQLIACRTTKTDITRGDCLDRSGEKEHQGECKGCEIGLANKKLLCPPVQEHV